MIQNIWFKNPSKKYNGFLQGNFCHSIFQWAFWQSLVSLDCYIGWLGWGSVLLHYLPWCAKSIILASRRDRNLFHGQKHEISLGYRVKQVKLWCSSFFISFSIRAANALAIGMYECYKANDSCCHPSNTFLAWATHLGNNTIINLRILNDLMNNLCTLVTPFCYTLW